MTADIELEVPARSSYVSLVRVIVATAAEQQQRLPTSRVDDLRVAVSEATTNAIQSHQRNGTQCPITVSCYLNDDRFEVVVSDRGDGFDAAAVPVLPAPESPERLHHESGMGLSIMKLLVDDYTISSGATGTEVRLTMKCA